MYGYMRCVIFRIQETLSTKSSPQKNRKASWIKIQLSEILVADV